MRRTLLAITLLAGLAACAPAGAAAEVEGYVVTSPVPRDRLSAGHVELVLRSSVPLPVDEAVRIGPHVAYLRVLAVEPRCYRAVAYVDRTRGRRPEPLGPAVRVTMGKVAQHLDRRLPVRRLTGATARGAALGCDADPRTAAAYFDLALRPEIEPQRVFLTANAGPYLRDLTWTGWGGEQAIGSGTYVSDCASCGRRQELPARLVLERPVACRGWGVLAYTRMRLETTLASGAVETSRLGSNATACG